jgi:uncharacterized membrane protein YobD (UPF0266 family)
MDGRAAEQAKPHGNAMLQLVKLALGKPYTFVVLAILIVLSGSIAWIRTPTDIFPTSASP